MLYLSVTPTAIHICASSLSCLFDFFKHARPQKGTATQRKNNSYKMKLPWLM